MLLLITSILIGPGLLLLGISFAGQKRLLQGVLAEQKPGGLLFQPFQELLLGILFTFAGFYFAQRIFGGRQAQQFALGIAAVISIMTSLGAYGRLRQAGQNVPLQPAETARLLVLQRISCGAVFGILTGLLGVLAVLLQAWRD